MHFRYPEQKSAGISLTFGQIYYIEVLLKEGRGNDHVSVGLKLPSTSEVKLIEKKYLFTERPMIVIHRKPVLPAVKPVSPVKPVLPLPGM